MILTKRFTIRAISDEEMEKLIEAEPTEEMKAAYGEMLEGCKRDPEHREWYTVWKMELADGTFIGDLCFKGLSPEGVVEIGYGMQSAYEGKGYMTEAVCAMVDWARRQEGVSFIEAETDPDNEASKRVLAKAGFVPNGVMGEEGPRFVWKQA